MLILTADDYGMDESTTDSILRCAAERRLTSASAMVFMRDSERAATRAAGSPLEFGLHLNFTEIFTASNVPATVLAHQTRASQFLRRHRLAPVLFSPWLQRSFRVVADAQCEEFERLYRVPPSFYNGHHHMHLCANVLIGGLIPASSRMRNTFTFESGEKGVLNRVYRGFLRRWIRARYISSDCFYAIAPIQDLRRLQTLIGKAAAETVEIETHPADGAEEGLLLSARFAGLLEGARLGGFADIVGRRPKLL